MVKVNERRTLHDVLKEPNFVIPEIPGLFLYYHVDLCFLSFVCVDLSSSLLLLLLVFYIVSKRSRFYKDFAAGKWSPPS